MLYPPACRRCELGLQATRRLPGKQIPANRTLEYLYLAQRHTRQLVPRQALSCTWRPGNTVSKTPVKENCGASLTLAPQEYLSSARRSRRAENPRKSPKNALQAPQTRRGRKALYPAPARSLLGRPGARPASPCASPAHLSAGYGG